MSDFSVGTKFFDVEGTPVTFSPTPDGGLEVLAWDKPEPRPFPLDSTMRNGAEMSRADFDKLRNSFSSRQ